MDKNKFEIDVVRDVCALYFYINNEKHNLSSDEINVFIYLYLLAKKDKENYLVNDTKNFLYLVSLNVKGIIEINEEIYDFVKLIENISNKEFIDFYLVTISLLISLEYIETKNLRNALKNQYLNASYVYDTILCLLDKQNYIDITNEIDIPLADALIKKTPELIEIIYSLINQDNS